MIIARSLWRKSIVTAVAAGGFVWVYEARILDSKYAALTTVLHETSALPMPGSRLPFAATAYCRGITTTAGVAVQNGIASADPELLPVGSVIQIDSVDRYNGIYTVLDTGASVHGRQVDIYMWSCNEATGFGRRTAQVTVLRLGWNPRATTPGIIDRFFNRRAGGPPPLPSRPLPQLPSDAEPER
jgi:3D (Asp-Asp-Asp) domain-containing protein